MHRLKNNVEDPTRLHHNYTVRVKRLKEEILDVDIHINLLLSQPMGRCAFFSSHSTCTKCMLS